MMTTHLRLLIVEDSLDDVRLLMRELTKNGYDLESEGVDTPEAMKSALAEKEWDIVISDFVMPRFSGLDALQMLKESGIDIPFIIVSGKIGEETAVEAMGAGAHDYIVKGNLARLAPAIEREMAEAENRRKRRQAEEEIAVQNEQLRLNKNELEAVQARYKELYDLAPVGYLTLNEQGLILEANLAAANLLGLARRALVKLSICRFIFPEDQDIYHLQRKKCFDSSKPQVWEMRLMRVDESTFWAHLHATPANNGEYWITLTDISERKKAEEEKLAMEQQFQQIQKLESLGVLAGGIAHDFNNILTAIVGNCYLVKLHPETSEKNITLIEKSVERAAALCRQMLEYAGKAQFITVKVNMTVLVDEIVSMLKTTINQNVVIKPDFSSDIPFIKGDASQLRQVVMNLVINASEAIGEAQGEICVSLAKSELKAGQSEKDHLGKIIPAGWYVCLEVADNGCGMNDETRQKIFEPFYSTKFTGRGLGMSAVLGIIRTHMGALQISSQPGQGSIFKVYLPVQVGDIAGDESIQQTTDTTWQGSGSVLLVEDEEQIISVAKIMLKALGFEVIEALNGKLALELYQNHAADITLVVTDIGMPVMDGYELIRELKKLNPQLPIVVSSGFADSMVNSRIAPGDIAGFIGKPYRFDQLREVLKNVK